MTVPCEKCGRPVLAGHSQCQPDLCAPCLENGMHSHDTGTVGQDDAPNYEGPSPREASDTGASAAPAGAPMCDVNIIMGPEILERIATALEKIAYAQSVAFMAKCKGCGQQVLFMWSRIGTQPAVACPTCDFHVALEMKAPDDD